MQFGSKGLLGLGVPNCKIDLTFKSAENQPFRKATVRAKGDDPNATEELPLYSSKDTVVGEVPPLHPSPLTPPRCASPRSRERGLSTWASPFSSLVRSNSLRNGVTSMTSSHSVLPPHLPADLPAARDLISPGELSTIENTNFEFSNVEMQYDSYRGKQARCRYD